MMNACCVLYNPKAANGNGLAEAQRLEKIWCNHSLRYVDVTQVTDIRAFLATIPDDESVVLAGGDGTLNHFVNALNGQAPDRDVYFFAAGTGNDFLNDLGLTRNDPPFLLTPYIQDLPTVTVAGMTRYFINGIGYGIDGYCCEVGDKLRLKSTKPVNYTAIAIKGLLYGFHRTRAEVTVDGETRSYRAVWLSPTMKGRFFGGGMMCAPAQDRLAADAAVTSMTMTGKSKLKTLMVFPSIFKGQHIKHTEMVTIRSGHEVTVRFDRPTALQIDGETVLGVTEYTVRAPHPVQHPNKTATATASR